MMVKHLCVGGVLDGQEFESQNASGFVVPATQDPAFIGDLPKVLQVRYVLFSVRTGPEDFAQFWIPNTQTAAETIGKLSERYRRA